MKKLQLGVLAVGVAWIVFWLLHTTLGDKVGDRESTQVESRVRQDEVPAISSSVNASLARTEPRDSPIPTKDLTMSATGGESAHTELSAAPIARREIALNDSNGKLPCPPSQALSANSGVPDIPAGLPRNFDYAQASAQSLQQRALANDGFAQQAFGTRLQNELMTELQTLDTSQEAAVQLWKRKFVLMRETFVSAIRNRSAFSARLLGDTLLMPTPMRDPVEATAWLRIEKKMGGQFLDRARKDGALVLTEVQEKASEQLESEYIENYGLWFLQPSAEPEESSELRRESGSKDNCVRQ